MTVTTGGARLISTLRGTWRLLPGSGLAPSPIGGPFMPLDQSVTETGIVYAGRFGKLVGLPVTGQGSLGRFVVLACSGTAEAKVVQARLDTGDGVFGIEVANLEVVFDV